MAYEPVLIKDVREPGSYTLDFYVKNGRGYEGLKKALTLEPHDIIEQVKVRLPIWKQEHYATGDSTWLDGASPPVEAK